MVLEAKGYFRKSVLRCRFRDRRTPKLFHEEPEAGKLHIRDCAKTVRKVTIQVRSQTARDVRNLAGRAVFLASEAAAWITGTALPLRMDGALNGAA
jgi:hypothetical protein